MSRGKRALSFYGRINVTTIMFVGEGRGERMARKGEGDYDGLFVGSVQSCDNVWPCLACVTMDLKRG